MGKCVYFVKATCSSSDFQTVMCVYVCVGVGGVWCVCVVGVWVCVCMYMVCIHVYI